MPKVFYTERDIIDLFQHGEHKLVVGDNVVLTELAYEKAKQLGVELLQFTDIPPAAPMRPYISKSPSSFAVNNVGTTPHNTRLEEIKVRVREAVKIRLGNSIDPALLDEIIERIAADIGLK
jgi:hypothetical protein